MAKKRETFDLQAFKQAERAVFALSKISKISMTEKSEFIFLQKACEIICKLRGYQIAWVGYAQNDKFKSVLPIAQAGAGAKYVSNVKISWSKKNKWGRGPTGLSIRTGKIQVNQYARENPAYKPWLKLAIKYNIRASCVLPIKINKIVIGTIQIYAAEEDAFKSREVKLLNQLAKNVSFSIQTIRLKSKLTQTEEYIKTIYNTSKDAMILLDKKGTVVSCNPIVSKLFQILPSKMLGTNITEYLNIDLKGKKKFPELGDIYCIAKTTNKTSFFAEVSFSMTKSTNHHQFIVCIVHDFTKRYELERELRLRLKIQSTLNEIGNIFAFLNYEENEIPLNKIFTLLSGFVHYEKAKLCLFQEHNAQNKIFTIFSWKKQNIKLKIELSSFSKNKFYWLLENVIRSSIIHIPDVDKLNKKASAEKKHWVKNKVKSIIIVPLISNNQERIGFISFESASPQRAVSKAEEKFLITVAEIATLFLERNKAQDIIVKEAQEIEYSLIRTLDVLGAVVEKRDPYLSGHQKRTALLAIKIAKEMGLPPEKIKSILLAAMVHDVGKLYIPAEILNRPGKIDLDEMKIIKKHPDIGYEFIKDIPFPWPIAEIIRQHHERFDGSGYPRGLKGEQILLEARILTVADVVEAMCSHRPYRPSIKLKNALKEISTNKGKFYDPKVVSVCLALFKKKGFNFKKSDSSSIWVADQP